jgi:glycogen synthase
VSPPVTHVLMTTDTVGGVWTYTLELARALQEHGIQVTVAALGEPLSPAQQAAAAGVPGLSVHARTTRLEWMQEPWDDLAEAGDWLLALAEQCRPDIVHLNHFCHGELPWPCPVLMVAHSCVFSWHRWVQDALPGPEWHRYRREVTAGLRAADLVVAPSGAMLAEAVRFYGPFRRARVIANGRRAEDFPPGEKAARILCAGRLWDEAKNAITLARAASALPWPVEIVGNNRHPDGGVVELPGVELPGQLSQAALAERLGRASIYALPARYEPFGLSALEAAFAGCALVLGDIPSLREVWGEAALFVPPDDEAALVAALRTLIEQPELRQRQASRAHARAQHYTAERMAREYVNAYRWLCIRTPMPLFAHVPRRVHAQPRFSA